TLSHWALRLFDLGPGQYCGGAGGAGLGYGLGGSIGVALANRDTDRLVIDLQSDGDAMATPQALWVAAHDRIPLLIVVDNDRSFTNSVNHAERVALARGRPVEAKTVGMLIDDPPVDFAALARSMGVHGEGPVTTVDELGPALEAALKIVTGARRPALVDVLT
ncbi:MAG TPA: thiamine pyrophosphate-dependent enzyme, partial [Acidimicrobiales bacterium]|nr:thiamine pyrophosphate-dependent enzyme [Acidimicrobiales bacterium]